MNPLLFMPSPRDIPEVKKLWHTLPYDKFIVKYKSQKEAYEEGKEYFTNYPEYTHLVLCPDDLEIQKEQLTALLSHMYNTPIQTICGICNLSESDPNTYDIQPLGRNFRRNMPDTSGGQFYNKDTLPNDNIIEVGHCGSACRIITRKLFERLSFTGATGDGWWDWQISRELFRDNIPNMVDTRILMYHRRNAQKPITNNGYSFLLRS